MDSNQKTIIDLIKTKGLNLQGSAYIDAPATVISALVKFLGDKNFPTDKPTDLIGDSYVTCWFSEKVQLLVFQLSYEDTVACGGFIIFSYDGTNCSYADDTVQCED
jgi:hypothetical protein